MKDTQLKSQLLLSFKDDDQSKGSENIWFQPGFFGEQRADLTLQKANFPEITLTYVNQARAEKKLFTTIMSFCLKSYL